MKRFFGKRRATRMVPGGLKTQPFGRLGPLVFQLNNSDKLCWASLRAPTRIAGCALSLRPNSHPLGRRFPRKISKLAAAPRCNNVGFAEIFTISFSLCPMVAQQSKKSRRPLAPSPGSDSSAIHGRAKRSGCTAAAEPYPLSRASSLPTILKTNKSTEMNK